MNALLTDHSQTRRHAPWWRILRRFSLVVAPVVVNGLYASFECAQATLQHLDPVVFTALQLLVILPLAVTVLGLTLRPGSRESVRLGLLGGIPLGIGLVCIALALRTLGILPTTMLTALDGVVASGIARFIFGQRLSLSTGLAIGCAVVGALCLWWVAPSNWQTDLVALACGLLFTWYAFHVQRSAIALGAIGEHLLPFFGGLFASMALIALALALCFGRWETLGNMTATDLGVVLYCGLGTVLIPLVLSTLLLRWLSAVTLAFLGILEPLISLALASVSGSLSLSLVGWCGISLILLGMLVQAHAGRPFATRPSRTTDAPELVAAPSAVR